MAGQRSAATVQRWRGSITEGSLERWHPLAPAAAEALRTAVVAKEAHGRTIHYRGPPSFETFSLFVHPFPATDDDEDLATSHGGDGTTAQRQRLAARR
ncbi:hypothetical protein PIB30_036712 [Stylosanthes scabra]|uniref:Uncharacterized protein n=1 Tax=Stylosanthes scabra TaxID=79078 RepID=A0ABU6ZAG7_9FABA|nr:hypothetical protein [Stylosanthes scabra]